MLELHNWFELYNEVQLFFDENALLMNANGREHSIKKNIVFFLISIQEFKIYWDNKNSPESGLNVRFAQRLSWTRTITTAAA